MQEKPRKMASTRQEKNFLMGELGEFLKGGHSLGRQFRAVWGDEKKTKKRIGVQSSSKINIGKCRRGVLDGQTTGMWVPFL